MLLTYDFSLVLTSLVVAVLASYTALHLASRVSVARGRAASLAWLAGGALSMGAGIWSMHFLGMLGSNLGIAMVYGPGWTLLSLVIAVAVSGFALFLVSGKAMSRLSLALGGTVMGGGIVSMHYAGMMALQISPAIRFEPVLVAASVLVAVAASVIALALFTALRSPALRHPRVKRGASALVMGLAVAGMHYTGMAAAQFAPGSICTAPGQAASHAWLAGTIAVFTLLILAIALITSLYDAHLIGQAALHHARLLQSNEELRRESLELERANRQIRRQARHLEALNAQLESRVARRTAQLQESVRELEAFSQAVAHDLRGPLSTIGGFCGWLGKPAAGALSDKGQHYLQRIKASTEHMAELIEALLALSQLSRVELRREPVDLSALAHQALAGCQAREPGRSVHCTVRPGMHCLGDGRLLRQVLENLIGNAWKFSSRQAHAAIKVGAEPGPPARPVFFVRDNGAGFDMAHADKLFGPFQRLHSQAEFDGTGIGLATVHRIVRRHEGRVWAESAPGAGASFFFTLWEPGPTWSPDGTPKDLNISQTGLMRLPSMQSQLLIK